MQGAREREKRKDSDKQGKVTTSNDCCLFSIIARREKNRLFSQSMPASILAQPSFFLAIPVSNECRVDSFFSNFDQIALMLVSTDFSFFPFVFLFLPLAFVHTVILLIDKIRKLIEKQTFPSVLARSTAYEGQMFVIVMFIYD